MHVRNPAARSLEAPGDLLDRGVYRAPCLSPRGEIILYAVDHSHCHLDYELGGVRYVPLGDNPIPIDHELWDLLNRVDPLPSVPARAS